LVSTVNTKAASLRRARGDGGSVRSRSTTGATSHPKPGPCARLGS